jgi:hypothetical protein
MLLNQGQGSRKPILSKESFELMTQPVIEAQEEGKGSYYGYGLETKEVDGHTYISHGGGMVGYYSYIMLDMDDGLGIVVLMNGPGEQSDEEIAMFGVKLLRSALRDQALPDVPCSDLSKIENASEYIGTYRIFSGHDHTMDSEQFTLMAENGHLILHYGSERITLERRGRDSFYVDHPSFALFLLRFGRQNGQIAEAFHGLHWYTKEGYTGPKSFDYPQEWDAYPGHYRSHNPWFSNFRIILRKGRLTLVDPSGEEGLMAHLGDSLFRVGEDDRSPERISFDAIINNQALRAYLSGSEYYRTFTT